LVVVISCSHFPDDERIYHKEIKTILEEGYFVKYFTFAESIIDINDKNIIHINYDKSEYFNIFKLFDLKIQKYLQRIYVSKYASLSF